jgi:hypothetical protein
MSVETIMGQFSLPRAREEEEEGLFSLENLIYVVIS